MFSSLQSLRPTRVQPIAFGQLVRPWATNTLSESDAQLGVRGVSMDSADMGPGEVFVGVPGARVHGASFAAQAIAAGAMAVVTDQAGADLLQAEGLDVPVAIVADPRAVAGHLARQVYADPSRRLKVVGVTGTNGKTTTSYLLRSIFRGCGYRVALLGTVEIQVGERVVEATRTTVEAPVLQRLLALACEEGAQVAVVETSSHALELHRVEDVHYVAAGFTNLQHEHLDYHHDMASYFAAKARLFTPEMCGRAVISLDDEWGQVLASQTAVEHLTVRTPLAGGAPLLETDRPGPGRLPDPIDGAQLDARADLLARDVSVDPHRGVTEFTLRTPQGSFPVQIPFLGQINVQNACVALGIAHYAGLEWQQAVAAIAQADPVPGRLQRVGGGGDLPLALVDYAHTAEALDKMLATVRGFTKGKLHIVMGSDGDRDASKRPYMGQVVAKWGDFVWLTDENPRFEDPAQIRAQIRAGMEQQRPGLEGITEVTTCRRDAVRRAMLAAGPGDTVIATGKGMEPYQEITGVKHHYLDSDVMLEVLDYLKKGK